LAQARAEMRSRLRTQQRIEKIEESPEENTIANPSSISRRKQAIRNRSRRPDLKKKTPVETTKSTPENSKQQKRTRQRVKLRSKSKKVAPVKIEGDENVHTRKAPRIKAVKKDQAGKYAMRRRPSKKNKKDQALRKRTRLQVKRVSKQNQTQPSQRRVGSVQSRVHQTQPIRIHSGAEEAVLPALVLPPGAVEAQQRSDSEIEDLLETSES